MSKINIAVIPARGGSQRIPRKNIRKLNGKPLIAYSIETAIKSGLFDQVVVSTDDEEIAAVARKYGAKTPFSRPSDLADNFTGTTPVMQHALRTLMKQGLEIDKACLIYATCPQLQPHYLVEGINKLIQYRFSFSATTFPFPIQRALRHLKKGGVEPMYPEQINQRSQDLEEAIHDAGQFYWGRAQDWLDKPRMFETTSAPIMIPRYLTQDLDTEEDWMVMEKCISPML